MALHLDAKAGDVLVVGDTRIQLVHKSGRRVRLSITGPADVELLKEAERVGAPENELEMADGRGT